jgi:hypothetical protein
MCLQESLLSLRSPLIISRCYSSRYEGTIFEDRRLQLGSASAFSAFQLGDATASVPLPFLALCCFRRWFLTLFPQPAYPHTVPRADWLLPG